MLTTSVMVLQTTHYFHSDLIALNVDTIMHHVPIPQPMEVFVDDETKLMLHGLQQHYVVVQDKEKNRKLFDLLDVLEFNQIW